MSANIIEEWKLIMWRAPSKYSLMPRVLAAVTVVQRRVNVHNLNISQCQIDSVGSETEGRGEGKSKGRWKTIIQKHYSLCKLFQLLRECARQLLLYVIQGVKN